MEIVHRTIKANGIQMHVAEAGSGPLVLMLHGFPEGWYSWRHQLAELAEAGFHAVAPDLRGYGQTDRPTEIAKYSMHYLVGDVIALLDSLDEPKAVIVGHDWGGTVAWNTALWRSDRVKGVVGLSSAFRTRGVRPPLEVYRELRGERYYYLYFQEPGVAERDLERDVRRTLLGLLTAESGDAPSPYDGMVGAEGMANSFPASETLPSWLSAADLDHFITQFQNTGFRGALNWYRNSNRNWEMTAPWQGAVVTPPALYMVGDKDITSGSATETEVFSGLKAVVPNLTRAIVLDGCGHWIQQERPEDVNAALIAFMRGL